MNRIRSQEKSSHSNKYALSQPLLFTRAVTIANFVFECVDFCRLQIRLMLYDKFIQISEKIKQHLKSVNVQLRILNMTFYRKNSNKLIIKHQSNPKSTKIYAFEHKIYNCHSPTHNHLFHLYCKCDWAWCCVFIYIYSLIKSLLCPCSVVIIFSCYGLLALSKLFQ